MTNVNNIPFLLFFAYCVRVRVQVTRNIDAVESTYFGKFRETNNAFESYGYIFTIMAIIILST